ncbi:MAG: fructose-6-phosphate aldolase [Deltaproteobacteria bacterium]|nr:fructose-6-phosphate aldolase [Deltaproteobacteria bacterium]
MKFFIDSASIKEIESAVELGLVDGVTTNPSLLSKEQGKPRELIKKICQLVEGPVNAEVVALDAPGMVKEAQSLARMSKCICVKIPMTTEGLKAVKILSGMGIPTNVTLVFSPLQALLAAKAGAAYVSPFIGRLDDLAQDGMELVQQIVTIFNNYGFETEIIVASVRNPVHVLNAALMGADIATIPYKVLLQLAAHPLTDSGLKKFLEDWAKIPQK